MKSKRIVKTYKTLRQAERYQNLLYNKFDSVKLVRSPMFTEYGIYAWEVSGEIAPKRNPQPKKKNAGSTFPKSLLFSQREIDTVYIDASEGSLAIIITLEDGKEIKAFSCNRLQINNTKMTGSGLVTHLIDKYVK